MPEQIALELSLDVNATFENFWVGRNEQLVSHLTHILNDSAEQWVYLAGSKNVGKSHLLQALSAVGQDRSINAAYLNMHEFFDVYTSLVSESNDNLSEIPVHLLEAFEQYDLLCIDDVDALAGSSQLQEAFFYLLVQLKDSLRSRIVFAATNVPTEINLSLADLESRLSHASCFQLNDYSDEEKLDIIQFRASRFGLDLQSEVAAFIIQRYSRDLGDLMLALGLLDNASLSQSRKLTIPFVKGVLNL